MALSRTKNIFFFACIFLSQCLFIFCEHPVVNHQNLNKNITDHNDGLPDWIAIILPFLTTWSQLYFPTSPGVKNSQCRDDSNKYKSQVASSPWALEMLDASGKLPDGIGIGNTYMIGSYEECVRIGTEDDVYNAPFRGKYCKGSIRFSIEGGYNENEMTLASILDSIPKNQDGNIGGSVAGALASSWRGLTFGLCVPESCSSEDVSIHTNDTLAAILLPNVTLYSRFYSDSCLTIDPIPVSFDTLDIVFTSIISVVAAIILLSTALDMWALYGDFWSCRTSQGELSAKLSNTPGGKVLAAFSLYRNGKKIVDTGSGGSRSITCLHGIRFVSMTWVIYGHGNINLFGNNMVSNTVMEASKNVALQIMFNAYLAVDTFLYLSGFLVAYSLLPQLAAISKDKVRFPLIYLHRYLRLTPAYLAVIGFLATVRGKFMTWAPETPSTYSRDGCRDVWWRMILYIHTLFDGTVYQKENTSCMAQGWYLSVDMQLFLLAPPLILVAWKLPVKHRHAFMAAVTTIFMLIPGILTWVYDYGPTDVMQADKNPDAPSQHNVIYKKPWCRAVPYLIGIWLAIWIEERKGKKLSLHPIVVTVGWLTALVVGLSIEYGMYPYNQPGPATYSTFTAVAYATLHRPAWAMCLSWVVVTCHFGYGGPINSLLSWSAFVPLSKLTYCAYLVHFIVLDLFWDNTRVMFKDQLLMSWVFITSVTVSLAFGMILALLIEAPALNLEKILINFLTGSNKTTGVSNELKEKSSIIQMEKNGLDNKAFTDIENAKQNRIK